MMHPKIDASDYPLFMRPPTSKEKQSYIRQWGGITPGGCLLAMLCMGFIGLVAGVAISPWIAP